MLSEQNRFKNVKGFDILKILRCPIPWCLLHRSPKQTDVKFLKFHLRQKHSYKERMKIADILGFSNYSDEISHIDYLISQGIVVSQ